MEEKRIVKPWQAGLMLLVGIAVIIVGLLVMKLNNRIVLALDGVIMCLMAWCFGIPYAELQQGIKETVSSMIVAILILLAVGVLVGTWMASGTVPVMIYYGMKVLTPGLFLPVVCILCTLMSTMAGTSWGTLATVGVACMGVAQGLGVPLPAAAGAVCTGAFFGDKVSPLSDSPVITATVCEVPLMDGIRHALISTGPAYLISLVFYFVYGLRYSGGSVGGEVYEDILSTVSAEFWLSPVLLLPVLVVVVLILMKKPTIPTFIAGIAAGAVMAMLCQGVSLHDILTVMYSGFSADTGSDVVNSMLNRGGFTSMLSTIGLLIAAGIFGAPLRTAGVVDVLLAFVERIAKTSRSMSLGVLILHAVFFTITGAYYVSYPVVGGMVKDLYPEYHLDRKNLMRTMLDTGTGLAPIYAAHLDEINGKILACFVADEEGLSKGTYQLVAEDVIHADYAIMGECRYDNVAVGFRGRYSFEVTVHGQTAHASHYPEVGENALISGGRLAAAIEALPTLQHPHLKHGTWCVRYMEGGNPGTLVVPEKCYLFVDRYVVPGETDETCIAQIMEAAEQLGLSGKVGVRLKPRKSPYMQSFAVEEDHPLVKILQEEFYSVTGKDLPCAYDASVCDSNILAVSLGIPVVTFGPSGGNMHGDNEYGYAWQVKNCGEVYRRTVARLLGGEV